MSFSKKAEGFMAGSLEHWLEAERIVSAREAAYKPFRGLT
jgi:hypothetical protein